MIRTRVTYRLTCNGCGKGLGIVALTEAEAQRSVDHPKSGWRTDRHKGRAGEIVEHICPTCIARETAERKWLEEAKANSLCCCGIHTTCPLHPAGGGSKLETNAR